MNILKLLFYTFSLFFLCSVEEAMRVKRLFLQIFFLLKMEHVLIVPTDLS